MVSDPFMVLGVLGITVISVLALGIWFAVRQRAGAKSFLFFGFWFLCCVATLVGLDLVRKYTTLPIFGEKRFGDRCIRFQGWESSHPGGEFLLFKIRNSGRSTDALNSPHLAIWANGERLAVDDSVIRQSLSGGESRKVEIPVHLVGDRYNRRTGQTRQGPPVNVEILLLEGGHPSAETIAEENRRFHGKGIWRITLD